LTLYKGLANSIYTKIKKNNKNFRKLYALCKPEDSIVMRDEELMH